MSQLIEKQAWKKLSHNFQWSEIIGSWDELDFNQVADDVAARFGISEEDEL